MYNKKIIMSGIFLLLIVFSLSFINSAPPVTQVKNFPDGYTIVEAQQPTLETGKNHTYYFFLYNYSSGKIIDNSSVNCSFYLADEFGNLILKRQVEYVGDYWEREISGENLSKAGFYSYGINCQNDYGGALAGNFQVLEDGTEITEAKSTLIISLLGVLVLFLFGSLYGLFKVEDYRGKLAFYWVSHLLLILISFISWQIGVEGLLDGFALTSIFRIMFLFFTISAFPMVILSIVWIVYIHTFNEHFQKLIDKGNDPETAFSLTKKKKGGWLHGK